MTNIPQFKVTDLTIVEQGSLVAVCTVRVNGGPLFHRARLIYDGRNPLWVSPPQETWVDAQSGKRHYLTLAQWPKAWQEPILAAFLAAYIKAKQEGGAE